MNFPVSRTDIKLSKNVENVIDIYVRDIDRKPTAPGGILTLRILDRKNRRVVASAPLLLVDPKKVQYTATISGLDLIEVDVGYYDYVVSYTAPNGLESLLFTDRDRTEISTAEVRQGPFPDYVDAVLLTKDGMLSRDVTTLYSEPLDGAARVRNVSGISSFVVLGNHYTGKITVQALLDAMPTNDDTQWFDVASYEFDDLTGNQAFTFEGNFVWVRFKLTDRLPLVIPKDDGCCTSCLVGCPEDDKHNSLTTPIDWPAETQVGLLEIQFRA
jgi:hypothetical protein